jgi:hypothetical protein
MDSVTDTGTHSQDGMHPDRSLVVDYVHSTGRFSQELPDKVFWEVYQLGDGFGRLPPEMLAEINDGYDWSHVRDSSDEAFAEMATHLRSLGYTKDGPGQKSGLTP